MAVRRRRFIRTISYLLAVCLVFAVGGYFSQRAKASYQSTLEKVRFEGLNSLCEYMHELSGGLRLLAVSAGDSVADSAAYVSARAVGALGCTGCFNAEKIGNINDFLNIAYDFAEGFSENDDARERAVKLSDYAEEIYYHLSDISAAVMGGAYSLSEYGSVYVRSEKPYFEDYLDFSNGEEDEIFSFASQTQSGDIVFLDGKETVSVENAKKRASEIISIDSVLWRVDEINSCGFAVYSLTHADTAVEICKAGGSLCRLINPMPCAEPLFDADDALGKAEKFLQLHGYSDMEVLSGEADDFTARFFFVPEVNGVLLLTSPVETDVCLASGNITYFDASEYIKNYRTDIYAGGGVPDIRGLLPTDVLLKDAKVCLADIGGRERLCVLAVCGFDDGEVWIYVDYQSMKIIKTALKGGF